MAVRVSKPTAGGNREWLDGLDKVCPGRRNPHLEEVQEAHERWVLDHQLVADPALMGAYLAMGHHTLAALVWPDADADSLRVAADFMGYIFISDDQIDLHPEHSVERVRAITDIFVEAFDSQGPADELPFPPAVKALVDVRRRWDEGMPPWWVRRTAGHFREFLEAVYESVALREAGTALSAQTVEDLRSRTVCVRPCFDFIERFNGFVVPERVMDHPAMERLSELATLHILHVNDLFSAEREHVTARQVDNIVMPRMRPGEDTLRLAQTRALDTANTILGDFVRAKETLPSVYRELGVSADEAACGDRYVRGLEDWMMGHIDWYLGSSRGIELDLVHLSPPEVFFGPLWGGSDRTARR